jgi:hypothetical protein
VELKSLGCRPSTPSARASENDWQPYTADPQNIMAALLQARAEDLGRKKGRKK